ncbi:hypothetical protein I4F81_005417 [Pyropia yezoensis]|uniref:Uncharacterized protein n=1 Tax=Pyropia yezoensis TaxID=2788 RepID=A0ACC3BYN3_PYRYE|nr:hypothetical protein I4F81_005417 [Neopyropia yezoensis]
MPARGTAEHCRGSHRATAPSHGPFMSSAVAHSRRLLPPSLPTRGLEARGPFAGVDSPYRLSGHRVRGVLFKATSSPPSLSSSFPHCSLIHGAPPSAVWSFGHHHPSGGRRCCDRRRDHPPRRGRLFRHPPRRRRHLLWGHERGPLQPHPPPRPVRGHDGRGGRVSHVQRLLPLWRVHPANRQRARVRGQSHYRHPLGLCDGRVPVVWGAGGCGPGHAGRRPVGRLVDGRAVPDAGRAGGVPPPGQQPVLCQGAGAGHGGACGGGDGQWGGRDAGGGQLLGGPGGRRRRLCPAPPRGGHDGGGRAVCGLPPGHCQ